MLVECPQLCAELSNLQRYRIMEREMFGVKHRKAVLRIAERAFSRRLTDIDKDDHDKWANLVCGWIDVVDDAFLYLDSSPVAPEIWLRWYNLVLTTGPLEVSRVFGEALSTLRKTSSLSLVISSFKGKSNDGVDFSTPLVRLCRTWESTLLTPQQFRGVSQYLSFPFRANLACPPLEEMWDEFVRVDDSIPDPPDDAIFAIRSELYHYGLNRLLSVDGFTPRHGPGAIAEWRGYRGPKTVQSKYCLARTSEIIRYAARRAGFDSDKYGFPAIAGRPPCAFKPVPKGIGKNRSICIEPAGMQFFQQGLRGLLEEQIRQSPLRRVINFRDTSRNCELARLGSIDGSWSTIDLSNASDRIPYKLVERVFRGTGLYQLVMACRSHTVAYSRVTKKLRKMHTSGSAACFPMETLIFSLCCSHIVRSSGGTDRDALGAFMVYGDDIVIKSRYAPAIIQFLEHWGCVVNKEKSFVDSTFTECCGKEYYLGCDVTPLRIPRQFSAWGVFAGTSYHNDVDSFVQIEDLANRALDCGLFTCRRYCIRAIFDRSRGHRNPAFGAGGIHTDWIVNDHLRVNKRLTHMYQRLYLDRLCVTFENGNQCDQASPVKPDLEEDLLHWFVMSDLRDEDFLSYSSKVRERGRPILRLLPFPWEKMS